MKPKYYVKTVKANDDYALDVTFEGGEKKQVDMKPLLDWPVFAKLRNIGFFKLAKSDGCGVVGNEKIDIAPESLYERGVPIGTTER